MTFDPNYYDKFNKLLDQMTGLDPAWIQFYRALSAWQSSYVLVDGVRHHFGQRPSPPTESSGFNPAPPPPHFLYTFDTIGQTIYRGIGNCRYPLRIIWARGITQSGDPNISNTQTFAAAVCAPIDPEEEGEIISLSDGGDLIIEDGNILAPIGWTPEDAALLATSLAGIVVYPGDEVQTPAPLIVDDKGASKTNAFRGIRYIIFPEYPLRDGGGLPQLSAVVRRDKDADVDSGAVEFAGGSD